MLGVQTCALPDRKSTRLNSSHTLISYAVFCLKKNHDIDDDLGVARRIGLGGAGDGRCSSPHFPFLFVLLWEPRPACALFSSRVFFFLKDGRPPKISPFPQTAPLPT